MEYDQNWLYDYMILYASLCYYRLIDSSLLLLRSTINQVSDQQKRQKSAKTYKNNETCGSPLSRCKTSHGSLTKSRNSMLASWTQLAISCCFIFFLCIDLASAVLRTYSLQTMENWGEYFGSGPFNHSHLLVDRLKKWTEKVKPNKDQGDSDCVNIMWKHEPTTYWS